MSLMVLLGNHAIWFDVIWCDVKRCAMVWSAMVWYDVIWLELIRYLSANTTACLKGIAWPLAHRHRRGWRSQNVGSCDRPRRPACSDAQRDDPIRLPLPRGNHELWVAWKIVHSKPMPETFNWGWFLQTISCKIGIVNGKLLCSVFLRVTELLSTDFDPFAAFLSTKTGGFCKVAPPARITCIPSCKKKNVPALIWGFEKWSGSLIGRLM